MGILNDKVAVITGATRGLGLAVARALGRAGAAVVITSRDAVAVEQALATLKGEGIRAAGRPIDVGVLEQVKGLAQLALDTFGRLDIWVNNAGSAGVYGPTADIAPEAFLRVVHTNILGTYYGSWVAMQHFLAQDSGKLINVMGAGDKKPTPLQSAYGSSKAWVRNFTLALAQEYPDSGVGVFAFQPGLMYTDLMGRVDAVAGYEGRLKVLDTIMRMWANPPEVPAEKVLWLASSATDGKTGLEVRLMKTGRILGGALREGLRRLLRRPGRVCEPNVRIVPSVRRGGGADKVTG